MPPSKGVMRALYTTYLKIEEGVSVKISDLSGHPKRFSQMGVVVIPRKSFFGGGRRATD